VRLRAVFQSFEVGSTGLGQAREEADMHDPEGGGYFDPADDTHQVEYQGRIAGVGRFSWYSGQGELHADQAVV
jgi:hypothetical protein